MAQIEISVSGVPGTLTPRAKAFCKAAADGTTGQYLLQEYLQQFQSHQEHGSVVIHEDVVLGFPQHTPEKGEPVKIMIVAVMAFLEDLEGKPLDFKSRRSNDTTHTMLKHLGNNTFGMPDEATLP